MKRLAAILSGSLLASCSPATPHVDVTVSGPPVQVASFVADEKARNPNIDVKHRNAGETAVFTVDQSSGYDISERAIAAQLDVGMASGG
jgi:hypothetical protein